MAKKTRKKARSRTRSKSRASSKRSKKKTTKKKKGGYKKGSLTAAVFALFDRRGFDKVTYEQAERVALKAKPDTTFNKNHFSWYKNKYANENDL